jgi:flavin-binding protein dodecin
MKTVICIKEACRYLAALHHLRQTIMSIVKVIEVMASSGKSREDAAQQAVNEVSKLLK